MDEHNNDAVEKFPARKVNYRSSTTIQPIMRSGQGNSQGGGANQYHVII